MTATSAPRIRIFDKDGYPLGEIQGQAQRSWILNEAGQAEIIAATNQFTDLDNMALFFLPFNRVLIQNENVPDWSGYLNGDMEWSAFGTVKVTAKSGENLLHYYDPRERPEVMELVFFGDWIGGNLPGDERELPEFEWDLEVRSKIGNPEGDTEIGTDFGTGSLYDEMVAYYQDIPEDWGMEYRIDTEGKLVFVLRTYSAYQKGGGVFKNKDKLDRGRGRMKWDIVLREHQHMELQERGAMRTEGPIYNAVRVFGNGTDWDVRPQAYRHANESIDVYGLRQHVMEVEYESQAQLAKVGDDFLTRHAAPRINIPLTLTDETLFNDIFLDDAVQIDLPNIGFSPGGEVGVRTLVYVDALEYDEVRNTMRVMTHTNILDWRYLGDLT